MIKLTEVYYNGGRQHTFETFPTTKSTLVLMAENADVVNLDGVNNVVFNKDTRLIIQACGYTPERGLFCDMY